MTRNSIFTVEHRNPSTELWGLPDTTETEARHMFHAIRSKRINFRHKLCTQCTVTTKVKTKFRHKFQGNRIP